MGQMGQIREKQVMVRVSAVPRLFKIVGQTWDKRGTLATKNDKI